MRDGLFITATDTGVGKTAVTCALLAGLKAAGVSCCAMKPFATGCSADGGSEDVEKMSAAGNEAPEADVCPLRYALPASPLAAARREGVEVDVERVFESFERLRGDYDMVLVEGIGGVAVPLAPGLTVLDIIERFALPVLVVARSGLGTLNHTILTIDALRRRKADIRGVVLNRPPDQPGDPTESDNGDIITEFTGVEIIARLPAVGDTLKELPRLLEIEKIFPGPGLSPRG